MRYSAALELLSEGQLSQYFALSGDRGGKGFGRKGVGRDQVGSEGFGRERGGTSGCNILRKLPFLVPCFANGLRYISLRDLLTTPLKVKVELACSHKASCLLLLRNRFAVS